MASHRKHEELDKSVHVHLAGTMLACAAFAAAELAAPRTLLLTSARVLACLLQGMWLIEVRQQPTWHAPFLTQSVTSSFVSGIHCAAPGNRHLPTHRTTVRDGCRFVPACR